MLVNSLYYPNIIGGAEKSVKALAESMVKLGHEVAVVTTSDNDGMKLVNGVHVYYMKIPNLYWIINASGQTLLRRTSWHILDIENNLISKKITTYLKEFDPEIVHTNNLQGFSVSVWKLVSKLNIRIIHTIRDYYLLCPKSSMFKNGKICQQCWDCSLFSIRKKAASKYVSAVVGVSRFIVDFHMERGYFPNSKLQKNIYNINSNDRNSAKGINSRENLVFGFAGMISKHKGVELMIESFLESAIGNQKLFIYGKPKEDFYLQYLKEKYLSERICYKGFVTTEVIFKNIDVMIIPSVWNEPFPRTLIEAFSYGKVTIASSSGGSQEFIKDGVNGFVFDIEVKTDLSIVLKRINRRTDLDKIGRRALIDSAQFSEEIISHKYLESYREVLEE
ncbi:MAG: glycosyltransferase family 4 protein [Cyclobacteriaceae bacterium]